MGHGACRAQGSAQRARSGPYLHVAPPFRWWQRPTSTVHRSAASKPRDAGREAAPGAAPHPPHRGLGSPDAPRRPHVRKGSLFPLSTFWSVPRAAETWRPLQFLGQCSAHNVSRASKGEARAWPAPTPGAAGPGCARLGLPRVPKGSVGHAQGASWASRPSQVQGRTAVPSGTLTPADPAPSRLCRTQEAMSSAQAWGPAAVSASGLLLWTKVHFKQIWSRNL